MNGKNYVLALAATCSIGMAVNAQLATSNFGTTSVDSDVTGRNPRLDFAFQAVRNKQPIEKKIQIQGSRFFDEDFKKASIHTKDGVEGVLYLRYDAYGDQFEIQPISEDEETQVLLPREDIFCVINGTPAKFKRHFDKKGNFQEGYLFVLADLDDMVLYEKKAKLFKEGKKARTSLELDVPNRFVESRQMFLGKMDGDKEDIQYFKASKKGIYTLFENEPEASKKIKQFVSKNRLNLKETDDVARVLRYYKTL